MIPKEQLSKLKTLPDQLKRERMVNSKRSVSYRKGRLTHRARQWASYIEKIGVSPKYPQGERSYGNLPMKERKK